MTQIIDTQYSHIAVDAVMEAWGLPCTAYGDGRIDGLDGERTVEEIESVCAAYSPQADVKNREREGASHADAKHIRALVGALKDQFPTLDIQKFRADFIRRYKALR